MVPGFMKFAQDDQIALLKRGKNIIIVRILHTFNITTVFHWLNNYENN